VCHLGVAALQKQLRVFIGPACSCESCCAVAENLRNIGNYTLQLQAMLNESGGVTVISGKHLPSHTLRFSITGLPCLPPSFFVFISFLLMISSKLCLFWDTFLFRLWNWQLIEWLLERTKYVPQLWNWENYSWSQRRGRKPAIISSCSVLPPEIVMHDAFNVYVRRYMRRAWRSQVEEPNNSI